MKRKNKTPKQLLADENLNLWKERCLSLYGEYCLVCGEQGITFHHFILISRNGLMKYDVENGVPLCKKHHYIIHFSKSPSEIHRTVEAIRKARGKKWCDYIDKHEKIHKSSFKTLSWLQEQNKQLKDLL
jgi:hypothetical protein